MFRRKDEDAQEELDVMTNAEKKADDEKNEQGGSLSSANTAGRPATPVGGAPGYRPQATPAQPARPAASPMGMAPAQPARPAAPATSGMNVEARPQTSDLRQTPASASKNNKRILTVGNDILLKGEIATCDRLVIEGMVDATLKDVHTVEISETGSFKGTAEIQDAEISGLFEGDLTVRNRLTIYATGKVRGTISYGEIEIERGGQLTGQIRLESEDAGKSITDAAKSKKEAA